jgi:Hemerythrin HHE cation binding domain
MMEARLLQDHEKIRIIASDLRTLLASNEVPETSRLSAVRWAFASALMQHLAVKERHIYSKLEHDPRPDVQSYFVRTKDDLLKRFNAYTQHMEAWPTSRALVRWAAYRVSATHVVDLFLERLSQEERDLLIYVKRYEIDISNPAPAGTNWTRKAFGVKDRVDDR